MAATLVTDDGVPIDAVHLPASDRSDPEALPPPERPAGRRDLAIVVAHGFTQSWQRPMLWTIVFFGALSPNFVDRWILRVPRKQG